MVLIKILDKAIQKIIHTARKPELFIIAVIIATDQAFKAYAYNNISQPLEIIPKIFSLGVITNTGGLFGIARGNNILFIILSLIALTALMLAKKHCGKNEKPNRPRGAGYHRQYLDFSMGQNPTQKTEIATNSSQVKGYSATNEMHWAIALIIAGILSNLIDRIARGYVIDIIQIGIWPWFNIADSAIVIGVIALIYWELRKEYKREKKVKN